MKAIILAGGEGTRLRPISSTIPKPMVRLFDRPVLEHIIELLKKNGINDMRMTLRHMPGMILDYFGDGSAFGVNLSGSIERDPLGTAGGVRACRDFLGTEPFLVMSGDCVCDFDLMPAINAHIKNNADVTIVLYAHPRPLEYGLVMTSSGGRVERFVEKPPWDSVFTNLINTGIYIITPTVLAEIPEGVSYDFAKDLFPCLLKKGRPVYGIALDGYWCDIGGSEAYLECAMDALSGKAKLNMNAREQGHGIRSNTQIPGGVTIVDPCYIGGDCTIEPGAVIGPCAVLGAGTHVGRGSVVRDSYIDGAYLGINVTATGAVVCRGAGIKDGATLSEASVIGENTILGEDSLVTGGVKVWPDKNIPPGTKVSESIVAGMQRLTLTFGTGSSISGEISLDITPEICLQIGSALCLPGRIGIGYGGGDGARVLAAALECGICAGGGHALVFDGGFVAAAPFVSSAFSLTASVFIEQNENRAILTFFGADGRRFGREAERRIEGILSRGEFRRASASNIGTSKQVTGMLYAYTSGAAKNAVFSGFEPREGIEVAIAGRGESYNALKKSLELTGCRISEKPNYLPRFEVSRSGFTLSAIDEEGRAISHEKLLVILALLEFENGCGRAAVPYTAPAALELLADGYGASILRVGRDGSEADSLYSIQPHMRDGVFAAARIVSGMALRNETLSSLARRVPDFSLYSREVPIHRDRGAVMRDLLISCSEYSSELCEGVTLDTGRGWVHFYPTSDKCAIHVRAEGKDAEAAEELCIDFEDIIKLIDKSQ